MPLRQVIEQRKKVKSKKARPPRIYKRKGVKYIRPGKNKIKVSDVNLIINNQISTRSRGGNPRGQKNYKDRQKKAKELMETKAKLAQMFNDLTISENKRKEALRIQQIKEEALAKTDEEKRALLEEHKRELARLNDGYAERTREIQGSIEREKRQVEQMTGQLMGMLASNAKLIGDTAIAKKNAETEEKRKASIAARKFAEGSVKVYTMPNKKPEQEPEQEPEPEPEQDSTDDEKKNTDIPDNDAILMLPTITDTSGNGKKTGPCGMSNVQIDAAMNNEPMYLKTISADQIPNLAVMANLALDEYKQCGFIVNTDPVGVVDTEHWVAVYIDCDHENVLYYYDSFGDPPTPLIAAGLKELVHKLDIPHYLAFEYNYIVNQDINSSLCGVHCILVLTELFAGMSTELAVDHREGAAKAFKYYI